MEKIINNTLFLTLSTFSNTGGIQKVCRTLCKTLADLSADLYPLQVLSLCDHSNDVDERYLPSNKFIGFSYHRLHFAFEAIKKGRTTKTILLSHINLIPIAIVIKIIKPGTKIILLAHGIEIWKDLPWWKTKFLQKHTLIWSVSAFTARKLFEKHHIKQNKVSILNNSLDPFFKVPTDLKKPNHLLQKHNLLNDQPILLGITRISSKEQEKGYNEIIILLPKLLKEFPKLCYLLAGKADEDEALRIQQLIAKNNLKDHVKLIGFIAEEELTNYYLLADIFVLTSKKEGFGLVFIEAAACGCKIICGDQDGSADAVLNGRLGKQIDTSKSIQIEEAIAKLLKKKKDIRAAKKIQHICTQHFHYEQYQQKVKNLLN